MREAAIETQVARGNRPVWILTLTLPDGRMLRYGSRALTLATDAGEPITYEPLLLAVEDFAEELDLFALDGSLSLAQSAVEIATPDDLASLQSDWAHIPHAVAELALVWQGQTWERRRTVLGGALVQGAALGQDGEATTLTLEAAAAATSAPIGDDDRDLGDDWPPPLLDDTGIDVMTDVTGAKHVWVIGKPESIPAFKVGNVGGQNRLVLCGHALPDLGAVPVYVEGVLVASFTPAVATTVNGTYTYVQSAAHFHSADGSYTWSATSGGIARADASNAATRTAADILGWCLQHSGLRVDWRRMLRALLKLASWPAGLWVDQETPAIDVIRDRMVPFLPIIEVDSGEGIYFEYIDPHVQDVGPDLVVGQELIGRAGRMRATDTDAVRNRFVMAFQRDESAGTYASTVLVDHGNSALCYLSQQLLSRPEVRDDGVRADEPIECDLFWDATTARRSLLCRASRLALPRRVLDYVAAPDAYWLEAGGVHRLTDDARGISGARVAVTALSRISTGVRVECVDRTPSGAL